MRTALLCTLNSLPQEHTIHNLAHIQLAQLTSQAEALADRSNTLKSAAARVCTTLDTLASDEAALAAAVASFCDGVDEESVQIGCPFLRQFVPLIQDIREEQVKMAEQLRALLVTAVDTEIDGALRDIRAAAKADSRDGRRRRKSAGMLPSSSDSVDAALPLHVQHARALHSWEHKKAHFYLGAFHQLARGLGHFFQGGAELMQDMDSFTNDMQAAHKAALEQQVRYLRASGMPAPQSCCTPTTWLGCVR